MILNLQANWAGRWLISLVMAMVLLLAQAGFAAEKKGEFFGAMETVYPDWFKEASSSSRRTCRKPARRAGG